MREKERENFFSFFSGVGYNFGVFLVYEGLEKVSRFAVILDFKIVSTDKNQRKLDQLINMHIKTGLMM